MLRTRRAGGAVKALAQTSRQQQRSFTSSPASISLTTVKKAPAARRNQTTSAQSTAEARDIPAPAFNTNSVKDHGHVQPLVNPGHQIWMNLGYPGGAILPVFDAIYNSKHFDFILPEQGAGHMAEGYARASGKPGVVLVTSVERHGQVAELPRRINEAFEIATSGRPGPVLVDLPKDVTAGVLRRAIPTESALPSLPSAASRAAMEATQKYLQASVRRVADLINVAKKPVIYAGQGIISSEGGPELLKELADKASIPVTTTLHGLGAFDELDEKSLYMLGMHGSAFANMAIQNADLIIALGSRFDDRVTLSIAKFAPAAKAAAAEGRGDIVHFEIMPKNINKVVQATEVVEGDVGKNLAQLIPYVNKMSMADRKDWFDQIAEWKEKWPMDAYERAERAGLIKPQTLIEQLSDLTKDRKQETIISTGVGQHQMWTAQHFRWRYPRTMVTSGGLGTMGYGLPAAIGAKVARPDALVIDIDGDASFNMTLTELSTASQFNIGVKVIVLNNEEQGMVTQWQNLFYEDRYARTHQKNPDFMKLADAMGVQHRRVSKPEETMDALKWLINTDGPALLEVITDKKVPVLPMVPAGSGLHEFLVWDGAKDKKRRELMRTRTGGLHS
ncbi:hypothetical protein DL764_004299 [Monosporascus ibericus]|uniref:acetolactate synthase n=1 Tax=Monosporascus ibericus TaxID=155417 RepID=A0A4Q4TH98_9PEZI|nr:hypothetical protein DL764_004299 [Monosporascus ibericus]